MSRTITPSKDGKIHARTVWCPACNPPVRLRYINLDDVRARKGCPNCKQKFDFIRTDTPEGRKARTAQWRLERKGAEQ